MEKESAVQRPVKRGISARILCRAMKYPACVGIVRWQERNKRFRNEGDGQKDTEAAVRRFSELKLRAMLR